MKKHLVLLLIFAVLLSGLAACSEEKGETVVTSSTSFVDNETDETDVSGDPNESVGESTSEALPTDEPSFSTETQEDYLLTYSSVSTHRDSQGNAWLNVMVGYTNTSDTPLMLDYCVITINDDGEDILTLTDVPSYPSVIAPGETGYYFQQEYVDFEVGERVGLSFTPSIRTCDEREYFPVSQVQCLDAAFGIEVSGTVDVPSDTSGLMEICAILFDTDGQPVAVLFDYVDAAETSFILSSDKLPEGMTAESFSDCAVYACLYEG